MADPWLVSLWLVFSGRVVQSWVYPGYAKFETRYAFKRKKRIQFSSLCPQFAKKFKQQRKLTEKMLLNKRKSKKRDENLTLS